MPAPSTGRIGACRWFLFCATEATSESSKPSTRIGTRRCNVASGEELVEREYCSLIVYTPDVPRSVTGAVDRSDVAGISASDRAMGDWAIGSWGGER
jgi:hypothetical protein